MYFDTELIIDLQEVKEYIENPKFAQYLLDTCPSFGCAAFVLQSLLDALAAAQQSVDNSNNI